MTPEGEFTDVAKTIMLIALSDQITHASLHRGPSSSENELPRGIYARRRVSVTPPYEGEIRLESRIEFDIPPESSISWVGFWNSGSGGYMLCRAPLSHPAVFKSRGIYALEGVVIDLNRPKSSV